MAVIDIFFCGILALSIFGAFRNGITKEVMRIASLLVAVFASMWGYGLLAGHLQPSMPNTRLAAIVAFLVIFVVCVLAGALLGVLLSKVWQLSGLGWVDRLLGAGFGFVRGILACTAVLLVLVAFQPFPSVTQALAGSKIAPWVVNLGRTAVQLAPEAFRDAYTLGAEAVERMTEEGKADPTNGSGAASQKT